MSVAVAAVHAFAGSNGGNDGNMMLNGSGVTATVHEPTDTASASATGQSIQRPARRLLPHVSLSEAGARHLRGCRVGRAVVPVG